MPSDLIFSFFVIFSGAAALATAALYFRQPLIIAYIALGCLVGPFGFQLVTEQKLLSEIAHFGIIFLLFLLGLDLQPRNLFRLLGKSSFQVGLSSIAFAAIGFVVAKLSNFTFNECIVIGVSCMFSSTIIGIKLLPTTVLHHKHTGEIVVSLLLIQDLLAILVLIFLQQKNSANVDIASFLKVFFALPLVILIAFALVKLVLLPLLRRFDRFQEYVFLLAIGWCLGIAEAAEYFGLSLEIGAFIAGISLASSPISAYIANSLKPLRDFFLVLFFFSLGASFNIHLLSSIALPLIVLAILVLALKPLVFSSLLKLTGESKASSWEVGFRLGQISEFSLLIAYMAASNGIIGEKASHLIQASAILTFILSSYLVVFRFPSPIAVTDALRKD